LSNTREKWEYDTSVHQPFVEFKQANDSVRTEVLYNILFEYGKGKGKAVPFTGLEWPRGFQEFKVPRLHDNGTGWW